MGAALYQTVLLRRLDSMRPLSLIPMLSCHLFPSLRTLTYHHSPLLLILDRRTVSLTLVSFPTTRFLRTPSPLFNSACLTVLPTLYYSGHRLAHILFDRLSYLRYV